MIYRVTTGVRMLILASFLLFAPVTVQAQKGNGHVTSEHVQKAITELEKLAENEIKTNAIPGLAIGVVYNDQVVYLKGFGVREAGKTAPVTAETVFQLASMSKALAATVTAALVSDGVVTWDTRVSQVHPLFQLHDAYPTSHVTIRDLFAHRSGLGGNVGNDLEALGYDRDTILHRLRLVHPASSFRSTYAYSNFGITAGAVAAAKPTGKGWEDVADAKLYHPLGMTSTSSRYADFLKHTNRASLHSRVDGKWTAAVQREPDAQSPAGGVSSNVKELGQWMRLQLANGKYEGEQLISAEAIGQTHLPIMYRGPNPSTGRPAFYGLGWNVEYGEEGTVQVGHAGAFSQGARTTVSLIPSEKLGIVVLANAFPTGIPEGMAATFFDLVHHGKAKRDWVDAWNKIFEGAYGPASYAPLVARYAQPPVILSPALSHSAYVGTYTNDYIGDVQVIDKDGGLALRAGPNKKTFPLKHYDHDIFIYYPYPEIPDYPSAVTFTIGADQKGMQVVIDDLNSNGQGVLTRVMLAP
jgi:CubicO group peptidase (beta-lactamase class C family)